MRKAGELINAYLREGKLAANRSEPIGTGGYGVVYASDVPGNVTARKLLFVHGVRFAALLGIGGGSAASDSPDAQIAFAFRTVTSRSPSDRELDVLNKALSSYEREFTNNPKAAKQALRVGESKPDKAFDTIKLAAVTTVANVLLNMDEVITRE